MKIPILIAALALCGCHPVEENPNATPSTSATVYKDIDSRIDVRVFLYEGHRYLVNTDGGILHAESCQCKVRKE